MKVDEDEKFPSGAGVWLWRAESPQHDMVLKKSRFLGAKARSEWQDYVRADYSGAEAPFDFASSAVLKRRSSTAARKD